MWLALLGLKILVQGLEQSRLVWQCGQESFPGLSKRTLQEGETARPNDNGRVPKTHLLISFDKWCARPWNPEPGPGNTMGIESTRVLILSLPTELIHQLGRQTLIIRKSHTNKYKIKLQ